MEKSEIFWQTYLKLEKELLEISKYIYITDDTVSVSGREIVHESCNHQLNTFSPHIADLIIRTCVEIEALSKELYFDFGGDKVRGDKNLFFDEDCLKLIDKKCSTHNKIVFISCPSFNLTKEENKRFKPLREAHKRQGTDWERAYQALKHDRYSSISKGTIKNLIHALGALYLLNIYYRDIKLYSKYLNVNSLDLSLGSSIFSVMKPKENYVIDVVNGKEISEILSSDESPCVLKYIDSIYKKVLYENNNLGSNIVAYLKEQPEFNEPKFIEILRKKENFPLVELAKYRLNKKMPSNLSFEQRKKIFVSTPEWRGTIRQNNNPLKEDELTAENIQSEIDHAGVQAGLELQKQFENNKMYYAFTEGYCELIIDKGNVKYSN